MFHYYNYITRNTHKVKWQNNEDVDIREDTNWEKIYLRTYTFTYDSTLLSFQFKLLHRIVVTNCSLKQWKIFQNDNCTFCKSLPENICHLFYLCNIVKQLWKRLSEWLLPELDVSNIFNLKYILFGYDADHREIDLINTLILLTKRYIYVSRCLKSGLSLHSLLHFIHSYKQIESNVTNLDNKNKYIQKWRIISFKLDTNDI